MSVNLQEIRSAVQNYLDTKVTVSISEKTPPQEGGQIGKNEEFCFAVTVTNANLALGGIPLKNVRYFLEAANPTVAKLIVPPAAVAVARLTKDASGFPIVPGTQVDYMWLFPVGERSYLEAGEMDTIGTTNFANSATQGLKGKSQTPPNGSTCEIKFKIFAEPDLDYLFPKNEDSATASRKILVEY